MQKTHLTVLYCGLRFSSNADMGGTMALQLAITDDCMAPVRAPNPIAVTVVNIVVVY